MPTEVKGSTIGAGVK